MTRKLLVVALACAIATQASADSEPRGTKHGPSGKPHSTTPTGEVDREGRSGAAAQRPQAPVRPGPEGPTAAADTAGDDSQEGEHSEWTSPRPYQGVVPGKGHRPAVRVKHSRGRWVTWPGFQVSRSGATRLFVQSSARLRFRTRAEDGKFVLVLPKARIAGRNNRNPLDCRFFDTPVDYATWTRRKGQLTLEVRLRAKVEPRVYQEIGPSGYHFLFVEFPAGDYPKHPSPARTSSNAGRSNSAVQKTSAAQKISAVQRIGG